MYGKKNILYWVVACVFFATTVLFGYLYFSAKAEAVELAEKYSELQRTHSETEVTAEEGLKYNRELVDGVRTYKQRVVSEHKEVEEAGRELEGEVRSIAEESEVVEYVGVDANGNSYYRSVSNTALADN